LQLRGAADGCEVAKGKSEVVRSVTERIKSDNAANMIQFDSAILKLRSWGVKIQFSFSSSLLVPERRVLIADDTDIIILLPFLEFVFLLLVLCHQLFDNSLQLKSAITTLRATTPV